MPVRPLWEVAEPLLASPTVQSMQAPAGTIPSGLALLLATLPQGPGTLQTSPTMSPKPDPEDEDRPCRHISEGQTCAFRVYPSTSGPVMLGAQGGSFLWIMLRSRITEEDE